jgi:SecD/SecF fusion protein
LTAQLAYLAVRFRWTYGTAAVVTLFHDAAVLLGVFAWLGKDFDGVFLAALLTVIGYSINDTVVVFDRIREQRRLQPRRPLARVANDACLQTLPRTVNTGLGAMFILIALYVLGGDSLTDFALALLVGTTVGVTRRCSLLRRWPSRSSPAPMRLPHRPRITWTPTPPQHPQVDGPPTSQRTKHEPEPPARKRTMRDRCRAHIHVTQPGDDTTADRGGRSRPVRC